MKELDIEKFRLLLIEKKQELFAVAESNSEATDVVELDQTRQGRLSRMDALQGQAMSMAARQRRDQEIKRIDAALLRISNDDYGYCEACGENIPEQRLLINPATTVCVACAEKSESE